MADVHAAAGNWTGLPANHPALMCAGRLLHGVALPQRDRDVPERRLDDSDVQPRQRIHRSLLHVSHLLPACRRHDDVDIRRLELVRPGAGADDRDSQQPQLRIGDLLRRRRRGGSLVRLRRHLVVGCWPMDSAIPDTSTISCSSDESCAAMVEFGASATSWRVRMDTLAGGVWTAADLFGIVNVSCADQSFCVAMTADSSTYVYDGATWIGPDPGPVSLSGNPFVGPLDCVTDAFCMSGDPPDTVLTGRAP